MTARSMLLDGLAVAGVTVLLLWPALLNGYPLIFPDSALYVALSFAPHEYPPRSLPYPVLLYDLHWGWSLWLAIAFQALASAWVLHEAIAAVADRHRAAWLVVLGAALAILTGLPWNADQIMPDMFAGLAVLGVVLPTFLGHRLSTNRRLLLCAIVAVAVAVHPTHAALALATLLASTLSMLVLRLPLRSLRAPLAASATGIILTIAIHLAITGHAYFSQGGQQFLFGRLVGDGIVAEYLNDVCPRSDLSLCQFKDKLPNNHDDYLWFDQDVFLELGGWDPKPELRHIVWDSLQRMPLRHLTSALSATMQQLVSIDVGQSFHPSGALAIRILDTAFPGDSPNLRASLQQQNRLRPVLAVLNGFQRPVQLAALAALPLLAGWFMWRGHRRLAGFCLAVLAALVANAAICGMFSGVTDRYQNRIAWIAVAAIFLAAMRPGTSAESER